MSHCVAELSLEELKHDRATAAELVERHGERFRPVLRIIDEVIRERGLAKYPPVTLASLPDWPRGLSSELAAAYCGISKSAFVSAVKRGDAPAEIWITPRRKIWLRDDLDAWLNQKAGKGGLNPDEEAWLRSLRD